MAQPLRPHARRLVIVGAALAALLGACGSGPTYSLDQALKPSKSDLGTSFQNITRFDEQELQVAGSVSPSGERARLRLNLGGGLFGNAPIEAIVDVPNSVIYMGSDFFKVLGATITTPWVKVDKAALEAAGEDTSFFDQLKVDDPRNTTSLFVTATDVKDLGMANLEDEDPLRHYQLTVPSKDIVAKNPALAQTLDSIEGTLPDDIVYDVYVTKKNAIRNITFTLDLDVTTLTSEVWIDELTSPIVIDLPADGEATDAQDIQAPTDTAP